MIIATNLKCNHTRKSFEIYAKTLNEFLQNSKSFKNEIFVFPPSVAFVKENLNFTQGAQNFYPCENGAFTGEIGKEHLDEFGIKCVLIGHSERRVFENDSFIRTKFEFAKKQNYTIIFCIGENLETKKNLRTKEFLASQLENLDLSYKNLILAYEPIYSIGTGISADINDIASVLEFLSLKTKAPLLYGGSVNLTNIKNILSMKHCSGVLIGSAAWKIESFIQLLKTTN